MGRINFNELSKVEELPNKVGKKKYIKAYAHKSEANWARMYEHGGDLYKFRDRIMQGSIGKSWDSIVEKIKSKLPEGFVKEHDWIIREPDSLVQDKITGNCYFLYTDGDMSKIFPSLKELKQSQYWPTYYLDTDRNLRVIKGKHKETNFKTKDQIQQEESDKEIVEYLKSIADYTKTNYLGKYIEFKHPTKTQERKRYDKETGKWIPLGIYDPLEVTLTISEFEDWCNKNGKTYFITTKDKYYTNLRWSKRTK